jgi:hypothetical protein
MVGSILRGNVLPVVGGLSSPLHPGNFQDECKYAFALHSRQNLAALALASERGARRHARSSHAHGVFCRKRLYIREGLVASVSIVNKGEAVKTYPSFGVSGYKV